MGEVKGRDKETKRKRGKKGRKAKTKRTEARVKAKSLKEAV